MLQNIFELIKHLDLSLLLLINGSSNTIFDFVMYWASDKLIWIPLYAFLMFLLIKSHKKQVFIILIFLIILIFMSDQLSNHLFKNMFERLRPCHNPAVRTLLYTIDGNCGGSYGFVSSHAANTFGLVFFLIPLFRKCFATNWLNSLLKYSLLMWASIVSYSRIYLGVHYPSDVICGALLGAFIGFLLSLVLQRVLFKVK